jgi:hypothetical protein
MSDLRAIPVDVSRFYSLLCVSAPEPRAEYGTGEAKMDRETGKPQYLVGVLAKIRGDRRAYILDVNVPGEPSGFGEGFPVVLHNLTATPWNTDTGNGVSYRADAITAATPTTPPASASGIAASAAAGSGTAGESSSGSGRSGRGGGAG